MTSVIPQYRWEPTPTDLPVIRPVLNKPPCPGYGLPNQTGSMPIPEWPEEIPDGHNVCSAHNTSYTYPCCKAFSGVAASFCGWTFCLTNTTTFRDCIEELREEVGDSQRVPFMCGTGLVVSRAQSRARMSVVLLVGLAGVAVITAA